MRRPVLFLASMATAAALATTACTAENTTHDSRSATPSASPSPAKQPHVAILNDIDPSDLVTKADAEKLLGTPLPTTDNRHDDRHDKSFPSNTLRVYYSNQKGKTLNVDDAHLKVTTKVIDPAIDKDGHGDVDVYAYENSNLQLASLVPAEVGLKDSSSVQANLVVHGDSKRNFPNPTQHDLNNPYGVYIWGDQKLSNGKTRPVRLTIYAGDAVNSTKLLALATKAVARMNLK